MDIDWARYFIGQEVIGWLGYTIEEEVEAWQQYVWSFKVSFGMLIIFVG